MREGLEAWEILYDAKCAPRSSTAYVPRLPYREGIAATGPFPVRRIALGLPIGPALFDPAFDHLIASEGRERLAVINLNVRRVISHIDVAAQHLPQSGAAWRDGGGSHFAIPAADGSIALIESRPWKGRAAHSHSGTCGRVKHDASTDTLWLWYADDSREGPYRCPECAGPGADRDADRAAGRKRHRPAHRTAMPRSPC